MLTAIFKDLQIPFTFHTHPDTPRHTHSQTLPCVLHLKIETDRKRAQFSFLFFIFLGSLRKIPQTYKQAAQARVSKRCACLRLCVSVYLRICQTRLGSKRQTISQTSERAKRNAKKSKPKAVKKEKVENRVCERERDEKRERERQCADMFCVCESRRRQGTSGDI